MSSNPDVPPFIGYVETTVNALRLIHAARQGVIPRITRRLNDNERRTMIKSGAVFVFSVEESGIKRWTDGLLWSPSRIVGNFLVYREINERTSSRGHKKVYPTDDPSSRLAHRSSPEHIGYKTGGSDQGTFKPGGLIKKTITVTIEGSDLHLISYYTSEDIRTGKLKRPSTRMDIMSLYMPPHIFRLTNFRVPPKVEIGPDSKPRLVCEQEDIQDLVTVECKVEDTIYSIPDSPSWGSPSTPSSPDSSFSNSSLYGQVGTYSRGSNHERWAGVSGDASLSWPSSVRRREHNILQDSWPSIQTQSSRWQGPETGNIGLNGSGYPERPRVRPHPYDGDSAVRRDHSEVRHSGGGRESSHRMPWHGRSDGSHSSRERRSPQSSFTPSPTLPFNSYSTSPSYSSNWTPDSTGLLTTPTLHTIAAAGNVGSYDNNGNFNPSANAQALSEDFGTGVEEYAEA
ncbi:hypothetical protein D9611_001379 [Ephemerocybe angulata]|uniref:Gti1/Pac2 family-domain-containing protein n=1 Tax=Ephemerocybe angulata TaxID=980116 RepID=A0A8H5CJI1_9AGAR|nr:hypothetical protein D9611_001379 [Tulosesus angulatus]